jgi:hypothetical protein
MGMLAATVLSAQTKYRVNNTGVSADFNNLASAVAAAVAGDILIVEHSNISYGSVTIDKRLTIYGTGYFLAENPNLHADTRSSKVGTLTFVSGSGPSTISGLEVLTGLVINENNITVDRCKIAGTITIGSAVAVSNTTIQKSFIEHNSSRLIDAQNATNLNITNCLLKNNAGVSDYNVFMTTGSGLINHCLLLVTHKCVIKNMTIKNSYFHDCTVDQILSVSHDVEYCASNTNFINAYGDPSNQDFSLASFVTSLPDTILSFNQFSSTDEKFKLNPVWPTNRLKNAGLGGVDIGMYGGAGSYILSGIPPIPSTYFYNGGLNGSPGGGLNVEVKVKGNK